jgi:hypothetical protein
VGSAVAARAVKNFKKDVLAILRLSAKGTIWKHSLEKRVRVGLRFSGIIPADPFPFQNLPKQNANLAVDGTKAVITSSNSCV